jgi:outer membrane lipoprotein-sorting protein
MKKSGLLFALVFIAATVLPAQPPPPPPGGGWGGRGRGGPEMLGIIAAGPGSKTPVTGAPYSAVETASIQQKFADGNQISRTEQSNVYRDSQGRVRIDHTFTPPNSSTAETRISIFDPAAAVSYMLNPSTSEAVKMSLPAAPAGARAGQGFRGSRGDSSDVVTTDLGTQTVNGVAATGTRTTRTIPAGAIGNAQAIQIVREVWISTALKVPVQIKTTDPRFGSTTMDVTNIVQAEPSSNLFAVPANYTVTTGSPRGLNPMGGRPGMRRQ